MSVTPVVAIVGRPNVGKSTLFNRLIGRRQSIVHDLPGVTRDRIVGATEFSGRPAQLVDTGGLVPGDDPLGLSSQVELAIEESDLLLFVVDGKEGLVTADEKIWDKLRRLGKPTMLVVNKGDTRAAQSAFGEFYRLGIATQILVSSEHGAGISDLRDAVAAALPDSVAGPTPVAPAVAIVGRPNVGKSSLLNRVAGENRVLVSPVAGTTRDPIDTLIEREGKHYMLIDTAGIRRRSQASGAPEELAVMLAQRQIERAEVAVLVVDAEQGITGGDLAIAGAIWEAGRAAVVAINKWDLLSDPAREKLDLTWPRLDELLASPPRLNLSCHTGRGVEKLFPAIDRSLEAFRRQLATAEVNRIFEEATTRHRPPSLKGKPWKLYYATQVSTGPPTFMLFANRTLQRTDTYRRYLENVLRETLGLDGVPVRLVIRPRTKTSAST
jgi:GTP-binding protein